ncbi:zinc finger protein family memeber [Trypanosoma theileri]|uniref:Zinc finger protein family memeber n=1 Tax=Trypanosoma theileri TaxID=67003 RepID=A0A1X0P781_9TRYP|nr:zinc finger protein family memeber [Trypanosoma theileri]ORC92728.1 zinc finger protein family memeber [Trypanosoma theileri]
MNLDYANAVGFSPRTLDEIWEQWNQANDLSTGTNLPSCLRQQQEQHEDAAPHDSTVVFDAEFRCLYKVPPHLVVHTPSARLNITRLVFCRNYRAHEPDSCKMGDNCKFVHADVDIRMLEAYPIHVNYVWRSEDLCMYKRLPPGEMLEVLSGDMCTVESIPSERVLVTRGALARHDIAEPLMRCKYYDANQTCFAGEHCNFIHVVFLDPTFQGSFKRAPKVLLDTRSSANTLSIPQHRPNNGNCNSSSNNNGAIGNNSNNNISTVMGNHILENHHGTQMKNLNPGININVPPFLVNSDPQLSWLHNCNALATPYFPRNMMAQQDAGVSSLVGIPGATSTTSNATAATTTSTTTPPPPSSSSQPHPTIPTIPSMTTSGSFSASGVSFQCDQTEGENLEELLMMLRESNNNEEGANASSPEAQMLAGVGHTPSSGAQNGSAGSLVTQEQLSSIVSQLFSLFSQRVNLQRNITVRPSPLLDEPYSIGTLLYLPHGASEALPLQPVFDNSFLTLIATLGSQQQYPVHPMMSLQTMNVPQMASVAVGKQQQQQQQQQQEQDKIRTPFLSTPNSTGNSNGVRSSSNGMSSSGGDGGVPTTDFYAKTYQQLQNASRSGSARLYSM